MSTTASAQHKSTVPSLLALALGGSLTVGFTLPVSAQQQMPITPAATTVGLDEENEGDYDAEDFTERFDPEDFIDRLGAAGATDDEEENTVVLETDILFNSNEWELPDSADSEIADLVDEVPEGASVEVHGHTDSLPVSDHYDFDNQVLSENRADSVAKVLEEERSDLELSVEGFGEDEPVADEDPEDPATFAANRRVEIRYGDE